MPFARFGASAAQASSVINAVGVIMIFEFGGAPSDGKFFRAGTFSPLQIESTKFQIV